MALRGVGAVAVGVVLAGASIEIGMRFFGYGAVSALAYGHANYNADLPEVGYAGRPNISGVQTGEGVSQLALNAHGFHDLDHAPTKAPGAFRLMVVGNSYSMAIQVKREDGYVARLGESLRECPALAGRDVETINLGVDGFTIHQQYLMLRDYGLSLSPDFVLLQTNSFVVPGDLDALKNLSPRLERRADGTINIDFSYLDSPDFKRRSSTAAILLQKASDESRLLQYFLQFRRASAQAAAEAEGKTQAKTDEDPALYERYRQGRDLAFSEMVALARAKNIPFAMTIAPDADAHSDEPVESAPLWRDWKNLAENARVPFLDVEEDARAQYRATGAFLHGFGADGGKGHLNRNGNAIFAKALSARICKLLGDQQTAARVLPLRLQ